MLINYKKKLRNVFESYIPKYTLADCLTLEKVKALNSFDYIFISEDPQWVPRNLPENYTLKIKSDLLKLLPVDIFNIISCDDTYTIVSYNNELINKKYTFSYPIEYYIS